MLTSTYHVSEDDHVFELGDDVPPDEVREDLQETEPLQVGVVQLEEDDWEQLSLSQCPHHSQWSQLHLKTCQIQPDQF